MQYEPIRTIFNRLKISSCLVVIAHTELDADKTVLKCIKTLTSKGINLLEALVDYKLALCQNLRDVFGMAISGASSTDSWRISFERIQEMNEKCNYKYPWGLFGTQENQVMKGKIFGCC